MGAVVNPGQHDDGCRGRLAEGDRQQQRNGRDRANARQNANRGANDTADQAEQQVVEGQRNAEAMREIGKKIHGVLPSRSELRPERHADIQIADENPPAKRAKKGNKPKHAQRPFQVFLIGESRADHRDGDGNKKAKRFQHQAK